MTTPTDLWIPRRSNPASKSDPRTIGRAAVAKWFLRMTGHGPDHPASIAAVLGRRMPRKIVRLWVQEDIFPSPQLELAARAAWPELGREFRALDGARRQAHAALHLELVGRAVDAALGS